MTGDLITNLAVWQKRSLTVGLAGILLCVAGFLLDRDPFLRSYLFADMFWTGTSLGCLAILMMHHVVGGKWGMVIRRICEAGARTIPYMAIFLVPVLLGMTILYPWMKPGAAQDAVIKSKAGYLNEPFFIVRAILYFCVWSLYAYVLSKWSVEQDRTGDPRLISKMRAVSAPGLIVFTFTATFAFVDWIMSLEPDWFSTMYALMFTTGQVLQAFATVVALVVILSRLDPIRRYVTPQHFNDLGNMVLTFTVLWAYLSFSQFLIIWAGNLPDEVPWYVRRVGKGWGVIAALLILLHFCVPFVLLLMRELKRRANLLLAVCILLLVMRIVDVYWIVEPAFYGNRLQIHWTDFVTPIGIGGIWLAIFFRNLAAHPILPLKDPRLEGAPKETVAY